MKTIQEQQIEILLEALQEIENIETFEEAVGAAIYAISKYEELNKKTDVECHFCKTPIQIKITPLMKELLDYPIVCDECLRKKFNESKGETK